MYNKEQLNFAIPEKLKEVVAVIFDQFFVLSQRTDPMLMMHLGTGL